MRILLSILLLVTTSCAYRVGQQGRKLPGGYSLVAVPVFKNKTKTVGIEAFFTRAMIEHIEKSKLGQVTDKEESQVILEGVIGAVEVLKGTEVSKETGATFQVLPEGSTIAKEYRVVVRTSILLRRTSDMNVLWESTFTGERRYPAAVVTQQVINTVNPLYNHNAQVQNIRLLAKDIMAEAFEQMTENF